jgi:hypothetical protein
MTEKSREIEGLAQLYIKAVRAGDDHGRQSAHDAAQAIAMAESENTFARTMTTFLVASENAEPTP